MSNYLSWCNSLWGLSINDVGLNAVNMGGARDLDDVRKLEFSVSSFS